MKILFRVDGGKQLGLGHVYRCLNLAKEFKAEIAFLMKQHPSVNQLVENNYNVYVIKKDEFETTAQVIGDFEPDVVVTDLLKTYDKYLKFIKDKKVFLVSIDDLNEIKFCSDIVINGTIVRKYWDYDVKKNAKVLVGPDYMILNKNFSEVNRKQRKIKKNVDSVLVSMGGSDPNNLTPKVLKALDKIKGDFKVCLVLGSAYKSNKELEDTLKQFSKKLEIKKNVENMAELMFNSDIAITSAGIIMYELACSGTPAIVMPQVKTQIDTANEMGKAGTLINLGLGKDVSEKELKEGLQNLISDHHLRNKMSTKGSNLVDGRGAERVKEAILEDYQGFLNRK